jgi:pyruvate kinase
MADHHYKKTALLPSLHSWHPDSHDDGAATNGP